MTYAWDSPAWQDNTATPVFLSVDASQILISLFQPEAIAFTGKTYGVAAKNVIYWPCFNLCPALLAANLIKIEKLSIASF